jgi:hypothetical protein
MFRFTIRDLLFLTLVAALAIGWWIDRSRLAPIAKERIVWEFRAELLADRMRQRGGLVTWEGSRIVVVDAEDAGTTRATISSLPGQRPASLTVPRAMQAGGPATVKPR